MPTITMPPPRQDSLCSALIGQQASTAVPKQYTALSLPLWSCPVTNIMATDWSLH